MSNNELLAATATLRPLLAVTAKAWWQGYVSNRAAIRMSAYAVLAKLAWDEGGAQGMTYKMHVGAMRGAFRRELEARNYRSWAMLNAMGDAEWKRHKALTACK